MHAAAIAAVPAVTMITIVTLGAGTRALWQNEYVVWYAATLPFADLWRLLGNIDMSKAGYLVGLHLWIRVAGDAPLVLRAPSVLAMAVAAGVTALIGRRLFGARAGLLAGLLMAAVPALSRYGAEASSYSLTLAAVAVSTLLLLRAHDVPNLGRWTAYGACVTCLGSLHFVALLVLIPHWLIYWRAAIARPDLNASAWPAAAFLGALPVAPIMWAASGQSGAISWIRMRTGDVLGYPTNLFMSAAVAGIVCSLALAGGLLLIARRTYRLEIAVLLLWALLPPVVGAATFHWLRLFLPRYYLFTVPAWALLCAAVLTTVPRQPRVPQTVASVVALLVIGSVGAAGTSGQQQARLSPTDGRPDLRSAISVIAAGQQPGDGIAYGGQESHLYARQAVSYELRGKRQPHDVFRHRSPAELGGYGAEECPDPRACLGGTSRIWLLTTAVGDDPTREMPRPTADLLRKRFTPEYTYQFHRVRVVLLIRKGG
jgi:mannosyltransferase